ncbi:MAG: zf-HC2 domain-containing protein [Chloroflexota bacterium]|nr:zf-HC2 domain-containing protein [Chloroflexota bacterium]
MTQISSCHDLLEYLSEYVDGTLENQAICEKIEEHLVDCEDCRIIVNTLEKTIYLYHASAEDTVMPSNVRDRLFQSLDLGDFLESK